MCVFSQNDWEKSCYRIYDIWGFIQKTYGEILSWKQRTSASDEFRRVFEAISI
jgi:hypothetical protein